MSELITNIELFDSHCHIDDERFVDSLMVLANCSIKLMGRRTIGFPESFN